MAFATPPQHMDKDKLKSITIQISHFIAGAPSQEATRRIGLAESFAIWRIDPEHFNRESPVLPAHPTTGRHYQVFLDDQHRPQAYAQTDDDDEMQVSEVVVSSLAEKIDRAMEWIDDYDRGDTSVNFLSAPSCFVYAFSLVEIKEVFVISAPQPPAGVPDEKRLVEQKLLPTQEFLERLKLLHNASR